MKLVLVEDVPDIGKTGDIIDAKDGYARNYLIPKSLAVEATAANMKTIDGKKEKQKAQKEKIKQDAIELAKKIAAASCTISMQAGEDDKLFGTVTGQNISEALKQESIIVDKKDIMISQAINKLGIYNVEIKLHPEVVQELKVWVIKK